MIISAVTIFAFGGMCDIFIFLSLFLGRWRSAIKIHGNETTVPAYVTVFQGTALFLPTPCFSSSGTALVKTLPWTKWKWPPLWRWGSTNSSQTQPISPNWLPGWCCAPPTASASNSDLSTNKSKGTSSDRAAFCEAQCSVKKKRNKGIYWHVYEVLTLTETSKRILKRWLLKNCIEWLVHCYRYWFRVLSRWEKRIGPIGTCYCASCRYALV